MIEQIKEYLNSNDKDIIMIGYELLKGSDLSPQQKSQVMKECNMEIVDRIGPSKPQWEFTIYKMRYHPLRNVDGLWWVIGPLEW